MCGVNWFTKKWSDSNLNWLSPPAYLIKATINHLRICKTRVILIVPEWPSSYFWPVLQPNRIRANCAIDFNPYYTSNAENSIFKSFCKNFKTIALSIDCTYSKVNFKNLVLKY